MVIRLAAALAALVTVLLTATVGAQPKVLRVGVLEGIPTAFDPASRPIHRAIIDGLQPYGWVLGKNLVIEYRSAAGKPERLPAVAAALAALKPDVILAVATSSALAAKNATSTIPIVMVGVGDPSVMGLIASLARPGGNVTGLAINAVELSGKRVQLLKEAVPGVSRVAVLWNSSIKSMAYGFQQIEIAAPTLGVTIQSVRVAGSQDFDTAFAAITQNRPGGLVVLYGPMTGNDLPRIVDFVTTARLPTIFEGLIGVDTGGLMALGVHFSDMARRAGSYVDRIARGARPADLPVEEPTRFELVLNLKTAKTLGITLPPSLLLRADRVIE
ncbi:MAG TPA: ABC transporter substrate-binding protein [Methylomirabilota bacterium]|jgi:putative ABC transport system substrate-binding protein|nr:ABC transporter substrate-binding protein [Methylomirabilota bacterium]